MDTLTVQAIDRGIDILDPNTIEESAKDQNYLFTLILDGILNATRQTYDLPRDLEIRILLRDREDFNANIEAETGSKNKYILFVDNLMTATFQDIIDVMLYWSIVKDDINEWTSCFKYLVFVISEYGIRRIRPAYSNWAYEFRKKIITYSENTAHLFSDLFILIVEFIVAHEVGHLVLGHLDLPERTLEDEYAADDFAYRLVLSMIVGQAEYISANGKRPLLDMHNGYTYLAPMMFFDMMELIDFFRNAVFRDSTFISATQVLTKRKEHLEDWVFRVQDYYDFHSDQGNDVYVAFLNMKDAFIENVEIKIQLGKTLISDEKPVSHASVAKDSD